MPALDLSRRRLSALAVAAAMGLPAAPALAQDDVDVDYDRDTELLSQRVMLNRPHMTILDADIHILEPLEEETDPLFGRYPLEPILRSLKPKVESLAREVSHASPQSIVVGALLADEPRLATMAYTDCGSADEIYGVIGFEPPDDPADKACLIVAYVDQMEDDQELTFNLAHEIFHTLQNAEHGAQDEGADWWGEGSADWFGHELMGGVTVRDDWIRQFQEAQPTRPLNEFSYDAAPFFFYAARQFDKRWVMELGLEGEERLTSPAGAATVMDSGDWLDWAAFQLDGQITYPDGRSLPVSESTELTIPSPACAEGDPVVHRGPPLSAQLLTLRIADPANTDTIGIEAGDAWLRIFGAGPEPLDVEGGGADLTLEGEATLKVAAILPGDGALEIAFTPQGPTDAEADPFTEACGCPGEAAVAARDQCVVGEWRLTSGGVVAWMQAVGDAMESAYGVSSSVSGTIDDNVTYRFDRDGSFDYRSAGGGLFVEGAMSMIAGQMANLRTPNGGPGRYCVRDGRIFIAPDSIGGVTAGFVAFQSPTFNEPFGPEMMEAEPTAWTFTCSGDSLRMEAVAEDPADMPADLTIPPLTVGLTRQ